MGSARSTVIIYLLLTQTDHVFEIICLSRILGLIHSVVVDHERTSSTSLHRRSKVKLLVTLLNATLAIVV